ncbi:Lrp/AsnC family transcriptional regulator [Microbacterium sp. W1N]|uniref:Lrp/AsnC family transcriptional regulator n=1 Tax=Microbacterium festucae TaxID=2977531 RepID=UPI0021BEA971|nr:Lrp/AsnC family transcriptional regulator [Microbacterium festucae]MCT9819567.1 Lrp/AsnC family transcriptional regulator [Microbacterium festucae]
MTESALDATDLEIIHALQIEPRVSWTALEAVLAVDAVTLARRWARIVGDGLAWQSALDGRRAHTAITEISCVPGAVLDTAAEAARDAEVLSIDVTSGRRDLILTVGTGSIEALAAYAIERFGSLPGVRSVQTHIVADTFRLGQHWTVRALPSAQAARVPRPRPPRPGSARRVAPPIAAALCDALAGDVRMPYAELAARVGISAQRAADYLARLRADGDLVLRTDVAGPVSSWPVISWYFVQTPTRTIQTARELLPSLPAVQFAAATTGPYNLILAGSARTMAETIDREADLERSLPGARIADRSLVLRVYKHLGRLIDADGRAISR